jgi:putative nucleotidyltransferase with HDIG domain
MSAGTAATPHDAAARWRARPVWAGTLRLLVVAVPVATGIGIAAVASRILDHPRPGTAPWWACVLAASTVATTVVAAGARRLLPLAALLKLSLAFPDHTPSRFRVALRAGSLGRLRRQVALVHERGTGDDAGAAAETILELATALNTHDARTRGHSERVRALAELIAAEMHLPADDRDRLRWAALLHDCGKLFVHAEVLNKKGDLSDREWEQIRHHPIDGARLAQPLAAWLGPWSLAIEEHHERWDGFGYPFGRSGADISLGARIVSVADSFEVMTASRSYQRAVTPDAARTELAREAGHQFDPDVVRAFLALSIGRLRWLVGPVSWLAELPVIRTAARTPAAAAPATLTALTLAVAGVLGAVAPPGQGRAAGAAPVEVAARPAPAPVAGSAPVPTVMVTAEAPVEVLAESVQRTDSAPAVAAVADPATPTTPTVVADAPAPGLGVPPLDATPAAACAATGPLSAPVKGVVEPAAAALAIPLGQVVDAANCGAVVPIEGLLGGLLGG